MAKTVIHCIECNNSTEIIEGQKIFVCPECGAVSDINQ